MAFVVPDRIGGMLRPSVPAETYRYDASTSICRTRTQYHDGLGKVPLGHAARTDAGTRR